MAWILVLIMVASVSASNTRNEMALANITRFATGDLFSLVGTECALTRCMEISHGTALAAMGGGNDCVCQCRRETPAFREDQRICVNHIDECLMASFGRGATKPQIPFVFLPLKGQIIYPSKEIIFTDVEDSICAVTSAQYLSHSGWVTLRDLVDNDVPFGLYRDEGSTYLQWRGSAALHARLEGRLVAAHVLCSAPTPSRLAASCAAFRVAGATHNPLLDVRSIPFHAGETVTTEPAVQGHGLSVLEALAIGVCVLMLIFVYAAGIIFYIHYKQKQKRKIKDPEMNLSNTLSTDNGSTLDSRIDMDSMRLKTNPLLKIDSMRNDYLHESGLSDVSEHTEDTLDSSPSRGHKYQNSNPNVVSAMVHSHRKKPSRPTIRAQTSDRLIDRYPRRSASPELERAPHSDLSILDCSIENNAPSTLSSIGEPAIRRKLYFNPAFFETELLKNPPPAAVEFLVKLREVMTIAKEKMLSKRFIPILSDIPEEELYHTIDLGWDIPCARRGRRFSAISLKRENSRRAIHCGGCPGCDSSVRVQKSAGLTRSNSCKTHMSCDDYKQSIVQKWLDEVPSPAATVTRPAKSVAKVSGTPRVVEPKSREDERSNTLPPRHHNDAVDSPRQKKRKELQTLKITESLIRDYLNDDDKNEHTVRVNVKKESEKITATKIIKGEESHKKDNSFLAQPATIVTQDKRSPSSHATRKIRKRLPPPPPPPIDPVPKKENVNSEEAPISPEVKKKMEAVIRELNKCKRIESDKPQDIKVQPIAPVAPKIVIPIVAADSRSYFSDDNIISDPRKKETNPSEENIIECDSLERMNKRRRFSLDFGSELVQREEINNRERFEISRERLSRSWRDLKETVESKNNDNLQSINISSVIQNHLYANNTFIRSGEPIYNNIEKPGALTIEVRGSPIENRKNDNEDFDPDTLDRKPKREPKKCVEKILLKSGGSFKHKLQETETKKQASPPEEVFTRKIGSLRQIYEARTKAQNNELRFYERRGSLPYGSQEIASYTNSLRIQDYGRPTESHVDPKPPIHPKQRRGSDFSIKTNNSVRDSPPSDRQRSSEERDRFPPYTRAENLNARRSGRRSARTRSRRVDLKKLCRTEDSGYLSTDSNESKRRARYLMQIKPKFIPPEPAPKQIASPVNRTVTLPAESDTDDFESLCDGRSESGGESVETDSVFFGNFDDSKQLYAELGLKTFEEKLSNQEQIDSGFAGETNIVLSGDSDSEHRSVISIIAGHDGRASAASIKNLDDSPYVQSVEC
ncbi:uncharacterized protein [Epargyreus clarus]|uniref:uncharacterized protein n=1 Tax=Epargyreus clarus TaxID=520877 RepID=UPI003C2CE939